MTDTLRIRPMCADDPERIAAEERAQGWIHASAEKYETRLRDAAAGRCAALVAELGGAPVGYITVSWTPLAGPLADMPEIVDFGVLARIRRRGVGTALMDAAETLAAGRAASVCLAVGLHAGYGAAQRLYARRGYVPDGSGVWYRDQVCAPYAPCANDDDLVLYLSKPLRGGA